MLSRRNETRRPPSPPVIMMPRQEQNDDFELDMDGDDTGLSVPRRSDLEKNRTTQHFVLVTIGLTIAIALIVLTADMERSSANFSSRWRTSDSSKSALGDAYNEHRDVDPFWRVRPTNLHLVLVGDSVTHYQYLSLVFFLRQGQWFDHSLKKSHWTNLNSFQSIFHDDTYGEYFFQTTRRLQPWEICDCVYPKGSKQNKIKYNEPHDHVVLNRYFKDQVRNNTVRFFHAFGHEQDMQGRIDASNINHMEGKEQDGLLFGGKHSFRKQNVVWKYNSWAEVMRNHIAYLDPKPEYIQLNAGRHGHGFSTDRELVRDLNASLYDLGTVKKAFWRTTTYQRGGKVIRSDNPSTDAFMCRKLGHCIDVSWTSRLPEQMYWDEYHNWEPVYRVMNEDLLQNIGALPPGYARFDLESILVANDSNQEKPPKVPSTSP